jgi:hypothetical protein
LANFFAAFSPILLLVILPTTIIVDALYLQYYQETFGYRAIPEPYTALLYSYAFIGGAALIIYSGRPLITPIEDHFQKKGYEGAVIEFKMLKIIFLVFFSLLIITQVNRFTYIENPHWNPPNNVRMLAYWTNIFFTLTSLIVSITSGLRILAQMIKMEFRFYLSKGYCLIATRKDDEFEKANCLFSVLYSYNKYLRRRSKIEIKDIDRIYGIFLVADIKEKDQIIRSVCDSLDGDKLKLARYLSSVYKNPESEIFAGESNVQKIRTVGTFLAVAIPIIISLISLIVKH